MIITRYTRTKYTNGHPVIGWCPCVCVGVCGAFKLHFCDNNSSWFMNWHLTWKMLASWYNRSAPLIQKYSLRQQIAAMKSSFDKWCESRSSPFCQPFYNNCFVIAYTLAHINTLIHAHTHTHTSIHSLSLIFLGSLIRMHSSFFAALCWLHHIDFSSFLRIRSQP